MTAFRAYQTKSAGDLSLKDVDVNSRTVTGYFASFNTLDSDGDVFMPGAFAKSLNENKDRILHLLQHNPNLPLGRPNVLHEDTQGLYFETTFPEQKNGGYIEDTLKLYRDGVYNEHSVGFQLIRAASGNADGKSANLINEAKLWEGSTVTWGANPNTPFTGMKQLERAYLRKSMLEKALHTGNYTDDTYIRLQIELKQLLTLLHDAPQAPGPLHNTQAANVHDDEPTAEEKELIEKLSQLKF
jgi:HK97 family phage prohead protease